jgi:hypothetical protein
MQHLELALSAAYLRLVMAWQVRRDSRDERGDVPGWVLITVMTAALVAVIYGLSKNRINGLVTSAFQDFR